MKPNICAIASTPRSGTHFLRYSLNNHPQTYFTGEFFRRAPYKKDLEWSMGEKEIYDYVYLNTSCELLQNFTTVGFIWHLSLKANISPSSIDKFIILERKNKLKQFVSSKLAARYDIWARRKTSGRLWVNKAEFFSYTQINYKLYNEFVSRLNKDSFIHIFYEDLDTKFDKTINAIQDFLGIEKIILDRGDLLKQETRDLSEIIENYGSVERYDTDFQYKF